jgi:CHAT domain
MAEITYLDFDIQIERAASTTPGAYRIQVLGSPAGQATADVQLPFSDLELENILLRLGHVRRGVRGIESPEAETAKSFGGRLFAAMFNGDVQRCLSNSLDRASRQGVGLRIRLRLTDAPELLDLPWEYLYNPALNRFFVLSSKTPLVRYLDLPERIGPLAVRPPLRVLVMIASPSDYPPLDVEREWSKLRAALSKLEQRGLVTLERLEQATLPALQQRLRQEAFHIFHFIGHGGFDQRSQDGLLILEDEQRSGFRISGQDLGTLLHDEDTLRLVILNACEGARASRTDPFAGTAQSLVQQGVPAVIAMQFEVTDEAAITLACEFYGAIADGYPVDAALAEARKALSTQESSVEWGTPVLYLRAEDGRIFDVAHLSDEELKQTRVSTLEREAQAALERQDWPAAIAKLQDLLALDSANTAAHERLTYARRQQGLLDAPRAIRLLKRHNRLVQMIGGVISALLLLVGALALLKALYAPKVRTFSVTPDTIVSGREKTVHLAWDVQSADTVSIEPGLGLVGRASTRDPTAPVTTTIYTLVAHNLWGDTEAQARVQVEQPPALVATIVKPAPNSVATTELVFEVHAYDPLKGSNDGDGIDRVDMFIIDSNNVEVYKHKEGSPHYCAFSGDSRNQPCPALPFAQCSHHLWSTTDCDRDKGQPIASGDYTLKAVVYAKDGRAPTVLTIRVRIQLPNP